ncbi:hypothetical protein BmR1_04g06785 [Babesia microti strain RI]|uniref:LsmAD domain-containing protein n=1 Tax=Babesia microti (strain RI) TaxID=1133968 RepID=I7J8R0_BABMR|nr:hypothetical protein BmR1_04g06785 [Babesia microti strain RI]CCF75553.1 hypothetical protein BmR1_04g06785 [Babesia microti strain RI]|eukprot:XP_012649961.1 hypothetical protein BmR1_04g06785 [Babesia microti strain RI]
MHRGSLKTDAEIVYKQNKFHQKELVKWEAGSDYDSQCTQNCNTNNNSYLNVGDLPGIFNLPPLYGPPKCSSLHVSGYDENLYTTQLDISTIPKEVQERASKIALEIQETQRDSFSEGSVDEPDVSSLVVEDSDGHICSTFGSALSPIDNSSVNSNVSEHTCKSQLIPTAPPSSPLKESDLDSHNSTNNCKGTKAPFKFNPNAAEFVPMAYGRGL